MKNKKPEMAYVERFRFVQLVMLSVLALVCIGVGYLHIEDRQFLKNEGDKRTVRREDTAASRGIIFDRNRSPLAVSTPVTSLWINPEVLMEERQSWSKLAKALGLSPGALASKIEGNSNKEFLYLRRQMEPHEADKILELDIPGVYGQSEYRRYYPAGEVTAQLIGLTNIDGRGQEGIELAMEQWLTGAPGEMRVIKDRRGHIVREADIVRGAAPGKELTLSIDVKLQYLAYRELLKAVQDHKASAASLVMLDVKTGEVLAMVNQPSFNPNNRSNLTPAALRNRAVTDQFEPGSVIKPFVLAAALESGTFQPDSIVDVSPGYINIGRDRVRDIRNYEELDLTGILAKSSNVGMTRIAQAIGVQAMVSMYQRFGFGDSTGIVFPGESVGVMPIRSRWSPIEVATLSFGYGLTVTTLQLAQAYAALANDGVSMPATIIQKDELPTGERVLAPKVARELLKMMETVTGPTGTAKRANIDGYSVAGKTGTSKKLEAGGYSDDSYISLFAGVAPADNPRVAAVIMVDSANAGDFYGGIVAAPVFSRVVAEAMRVLGVVPDDVPSLPVADRSAVTKAVAKAPGI